MTGPEQHPDIAAEAAAAGVPPIGGLVADSASSLLQGPTLQTVATAVGAPTIAATIGGAEAAISGMSRVATQGISASSVANIASTTIAATGVLPPQAQQAAELLDTAISAGSSARALLQNRPGLNVPPQAAAALAEAGAPIPEVDFAFSLSGWSVHRVEIEERMSGLYEGTLDLLSTEEFPQPRSLLGERATLTLSREGGTPHFTTGVVRSIQRLSALNNQVRVRVKVVPELWDLTQRTHCRTFQNLNVIGILREVLRDAENMYPGERLDVRANESLHPLRDCCVQYNETDLAFVMRLLEDEGLTFFFEHAEDEETLVIFDGIEATSYEEAQIVGGSTLQVGTHGAATSNTEHATNVDWAEELRPTSYQSRDWDATRPQLLEQGMTHRKSAGSSSSRRRLHEYPGRHVLHGYHDGQRGYTNSNGSRLADIRLQSEQVDGARATVSTNAPGMRPGLRFHLDGHADPSLDQTYLITSVVHRALNPQAVAHEVERRPATDEERYQNIAECIPTSTVFRPQRVTPRPVIHGSQTAIVSAERDSNEEIHVDHHGRVLVRFHWDQDELRTESQRRERSSCWVRVAQAWAGGGMGAFTLPRVGMEVVVSFLEGDPDRPLVTGCVYNGTARSHLDLPARKAHTTFRSESTPRASGNGGHNELTFEDEAGRERLYLRAQHNMDSVVLNNETASVGGTQVNTITGNRTTDVGSRGGEHPAPSSDTLRVAKNVLIDAGQEIKLVVGKSSITVWDGTIKVEIGGDNSPLSSVILTGGTIHVAANDDITVMAKNHISIDGLAGLYLNCT
ncbi:MAG: type VI secretion system tip protein TssI/VgrG [Polyangiales bacterium]